MALQCIKEDVVMFAEYLRGRSFYLKEFWKLQVKKIFVKVWSNVQTYFHGGVGFDPYVSQFSTYLPGDDMEYYEVYNASEGYFSVQDRLTEKNVTSAR
ncbi:MAG: GH3 auxin-responsive promoter family protein [Saprospiraceae bacterium]|nr:GH3 auxin-responsive promoter family protein [Saprospiraceae bacterium]